MRKGGTYQPNPDFYTSVLWNQLMGTQVLDISVLSGNGKDDRRDQVKNLRVYAHRKALTPVQKKLSPNRRA